MTVGVDQPGPEPMDRSRRHRGRSLRVLVTAALVGTIVVSMSVVMVLNFVVTSNRLADEPIEKVVALQDSRVQAIVAGLERRRELIAIIAADRTVAGALVTFRDATVELRRLDEVEPLLDPDQVAELESFYDEVVTSGDVVARVTAAGLPVPTAAELVPSDPAAAYLQYHYLVGAPRDRLARALVDDAGDGSAYSEAHALLHPLLREFAAASGARELMLVSLDPTRVVYSTAKGPDFGTDPVDGPFGGSELTEALVDRLPRVPIGEGVIVDLAPSLAAEGEALLLMAAAVVEGGEVVGVVVLQYPVDRLNALMTANGDWQRLGFGDTGQTYVVGRDQRLRSDLRTWIEDPVDHLDTLRDRGLDDVADAMTVLGTGVMLESVDTAPVRTALDGVTFTGRARGAMGGDVLAAATPLLVDGLDWVVVGETGRGEATTESREQLRTLLVFGGVLLLVGLVAGVWLARRLARPVRPLLVVAESLAAGNTDVELDDASDDEFGHLARESRAYAAALAAQDAALETNRTAIDELLGAMLPARAVSAVRAGERSLPDVVDTVTVVAVTIDHHPDSVDPWAIEQATSIAADLEGLAATHGLDRVWSSSDRHLFLAGLGRGDHAVGDAIEFVLAVAALVGDLEVDVGPQRTMHAGLAAGEVATGVVGGDHLTFGVWGDSVCAALDLEVAAAHGQILLHPSALAHASPTVVAGALRVDVTVGGQPFTVVDIGTAAS